MIPSINPGQALDELRTAGCEVKVQHLRPCISAVEALTWSVPTYLREHPIATMRHLPMHVIRDSGDYVVVPKGGNTTVSIRLPSGEVFEGRAVCNAKDNFNRRLGTHIALQRALEAKDASEPVEERA